MSTIRATYVQHGSSAVPNITLNASGQVIVPSGIVSSGTFAAPSGSVSAPGIYFNGDSNTGLYSPAADTIAFTEGGVEALRIDSSGRVGIGTSSPTSLMTVMGGAIENNRYFWNTVSSAIATSNRGLLFTVDGTDYGRIYSPNGKSVAIQAGAGTLTDAITVEQSGRVGIGTTSASALLHVSAANANIRIGVDASSQYTDIFRDNVTGFTVYNAAQAGAFRGHVWQLGGTEAARIDSSGRLLVGTSTSILGGTVGVLAQSSSNAIALKSDASTVFAIASIWGNETSGNQIFARFATDSNAERGSIDYNRSAGQVRYNVTSDRRLKTEIQDAPSAVDILSSIQVRSYKWKETDYKVDYGFVAQELFEVAPDAVKQGDEGEEVASIWAVDNGKLVPVLTKALQEAVAKIESLEARLTAAGL